MQTRSDRTHIKCFRFAQYTNELSDRNWKFTWPVLSLFELDLDGGEVMESIMVYNLRAIVVNFLFILLENLTHRTQKQHDYKTW